MWKGLWYFIITSSNPLKQPLLSLQNTFFFNWDSLHARLKSHYEVWTYKKRSTKKIRLQDTENLFRNKLRWKDVCSRLKATKIIGQRKAFYRHRIPEFSHARKETVDIDIFVITRNGDKKSHAIYQNNE